jgi:hypothetical protein
MSQSRALTAVSSFLSRGDVDCSHIEGSDVSARPQWCTAADDMRYKIVAFCFVALKVGQ